MVSSGASSRASANWADRSIYRCISYAKLSPQRGLIVRRLVFLFWLALAANASADSSEHPPAYPVFYAATETAVRSNVGRSATTDAHLECGTPVVAIEHVGGAPFVRVVFHEKLGFVRSEDLADHAPASCPGAVPTSLSEYAVRVLRIAAQAAFQTGNTVPSTLTCERPNDLTSNGRRCGSQSAYSRLGGIEPDNCTGSDIVVISDPAHP
jgi:hypothetical protein